MNDNHKTPCIHLKVIPLVWYRVVGGEGELGKPFPVQHLQHCGFIKTQILLYQKLDWSQGSGLHVILYFRKRKQTQTERQVATSLLCSWSHLSSGTCMRSCLWSQQHMLSPLGGEFRGMLAKGTTSCKPQRSLRRALARSVASKQCRQPGHHRAEGWGWSMRQGGNSSPCSCWLCRNQWLPWSSYFLEIQSQASYCPLSWGPRLPGKKGHTRADVGDGWDWKSRASPYISGCPQPGQGLIFRSHLSYYPPLGLLVPQFLQPIENMKRWEKREREEGRRGKWVHGLPIGWWILGRKPAVWHLKSSTSP